MLKSVWYFKKQTIFTLSLNLNYFAINNLWLKFNKSYKYQQYHWNWFKGNFRKLKTERISSTSKEKIANAMNIKRDMVPQSVKEFLGCQPNKMKQFQNLTMTNTKLKLKKLIASMKHAGDDQRQNDFSKFQSDCAITNITITFDRRMLLVHSGYWKTAKAPNSYDIGWDLFNCQRRTFFCWVRC